MRGLPSGGRGAAWFTGLVLASALITEGVAAQSALLPLARPAAVEVRELAPGVAYTRFRAEGSATGREWTGHLLEIDLDSASLSVELGVGQLLGQETTSSMVLRRGAVAGVNGGFSVSNDPYTLVHGDPNGFVVVDGRVVSEPVPGRPAIGFCSEAPRIRFLLPEVRVLARPGLDGPIGLNRARGADDVVLYTPEWGRSTLTEPGGVEVVVEAGRVVAVEAAGSTTIRDDGVVISASGPRAAATRDAFPEGRRVDLELRVLDLSTGEPVDLAGCDYTSAGPVVARSGRPLSGFDPAAYRESFQIERHPRTGVGLSRDGGTAWLFVIDGRAPDVSVGATLSELADLMLGFGAWWVYNLDGGGSTTMALAGSGAVNRPSDGPERRRTDAVLVFAR